MSVIRVYQIAREVGVRSDAVIDYLNFFLPVPEGHFMRSSSSRVDPILAATVIAQWDFVGEAFRACKNCDGPVFTGWDHCERCRILTDRDYA